MNRELNDDVIELGIATVETKGPSGERPDEQDGLDTGGLSDD
ncbi:benenodin family lasso peptide [Sphingobium aquiterrae]